MKINLVKVSKVDKRYEPLLIDYLKRLSSTVKITVKTFKASRYLDAWIEQIEHRSQHIIILLDERGVVFSSPDLAKKILEFQNNSNIKTLTFVVGDPYGFSEYTKGQADVVWSLSKAVFPSDLAWLILHEQIYRAYQINLGSKYHHV